MCAFGVNLDEHQKTIVLEFVYVWKKTANKGIPGPKPCLSGVPEHAHGRSHL